MEGNRNSSDEGRTAPSRRPADKALTQQRLPACKPVLDPCWVIFIFVSIGVILIPIGAICFAYGNQPAEVELRYDHKCFFNTSLATASNAARQDAIHKAELENRPNEYSCIIKKNLTEKFEPPIYIYYQLEGFYQNHRRYVKSRSDAQLAGLSNKPSEFGDCNPKLYLNGNKSQTILPCGLVAWSYFNDTFKISTPPNVSISDRGLASKADQRRFVNTKALNFNPVLDKDRGGGNLTVNISQDERFILWMRPAALPTFRKLWGRIDDVTLHANTEISVEIVNRYNTFGFNGKKSVVISTTTWLGGKSRFLGLAYLITGATSWILGMFYALLLPYVGRKIGQVDKIVWPTPPSHG